jgi:hypothetical protein
MHPVSGRAMGLTDQPAAGSRQQTSKVRGPADPFSGTSTIAAPGVRRGRGPCPIKTASGRTSIGGGTSASFGTPWPARRKAGCKIAKTQERCQENSRPPFASVRAAKVGSAACRRQTGAGCSRRLQRREKSITDCRRVYADHARTWSADAAAPTRPKPTASGGAEKITFTSRRPSPKLFRVHSRVGTDFSGGNTRNFGCTPRRQDAGPVVKHPFFLPKTILSGAAAGLAYHFGQAARWIQPARNNPHQ